MPMLTAVKSWWADPLAGLQMSAMDWFLFFGLFSVSLLIWGIIVSEIREAI